MLVIYVECNVVEFKKKIAFCVLIWAFKVCVYECIVTGIECHGHITGN